MKKAPELPQQYDDTTNKPGPSLHDSESSWEDIRANRIAPTPALIDTCMQHLGKGSVQLVVQGQERRKSSPWGKVGAGSWRTFLGG